MRAILWTLLVATIARAQPYEPVVLWDRSGAGENASYGYRVFGLGDQDGDGYNDFGVWGLGQAPPGDLDQAVVEFFLGGNPPASEPYMRFTADPATEFRFYDVNAAGDVNGDGYIDWWILRVTADESTFTFQVYYGGPTADTIPDVIIQPGLSFWRAAGDFNGDGFDDLYANYQESPGHGVAYYGGNPMDTVPDLTIWSRPDHLYEAYAWSFGDVNGDGYSDFVSESPNEQVTYIFLGDVLPNTLPAYTWENCYAWPCIIANDLNGDGYEDLVLHGLRVHLGGDSLLQTPDFDLNFFSNCSPLWKFSLGDINRDGYGDMGVIDDGCNNLWGTMCIYLGHPWLNPDPALTIQGRGGELNLIGIRTAAGLGDVNGDDIDDWAIGAFNTNWDGRRGRVVVLSGDTTLRVSVDEPRPEIPQHLDVTIYPNPFNSEATILLNVPLYSVEVNLTVYNLLGQEVRQATLRNVIGTTRYHFDATGLSSGLYLLRVQAGTLTATQKLMILR